MLCLIHNRPHGPVELVLAALLKAHYATFLAKMTLSMQVESYADGSASISGSIGGCVIFPCRLYSAKAHMQLDLLGPGHSGCDAAEVSSKM